MSDQYFWGSELQRIGAAGGSLRRKGLNGSKLAAGIREVLGSSRFREHAAAAGRRMATEDGVRRAVERIEAVLEEAAPHAGGHVENARKHPERTTS